MIKPDVIWRAADGPSTSLVKRKLCPKPFILPYCKEVPVILFRSATCCLCVSVPIWSPSPNFVLPPTGKYYFLGTKLPNVLRRIKMWKSAATANIPSASYIRCVCSSTPAKIQIVNLHATSAAGLISTAVIPSAASVGCDTDWGFWTPNHSHRAMTKKVTSTAWEKMVYPSPVHSV